MFDRNSNVYEVVNKQCICIIKFKGPLGQKTFIPVTKFGVFKVFNYKGLNYT